MGKVMWLYPTVCFWTGKQCFPGKTPTCMQRQKALHPLWMSHSSAESVQGDAVGSLTYLQEGKVEKRLQMFNAVHISAVFALFIIIPFSASDVSLLSTGFGEIAAGNELEKHQTVWVFFKKSLAPLRYLMKCGQLSEWRRMNLLWIWQRSEVKGKELGWRAQRALTKENGNKEVERWGSLSPGPHGKQGSSHMCSPTLACRFLPSPTPLQLQRSLVRSFKPN